ncbi:sugar transferase [bacterium]|nr:sugar transferase [candidate division CSSED10-310 bacterium]
MKSKKDALLKRSFDLIISLTGLLLCLPMIGIIAMIVKVTSPGPILFIQSRVGRYGVLFRCMKFRTMAPDSESVGTVTVAGDNRITPVGRFLRRYKLDELPQLWNVVTGKMSFVGPRPDVPGYADMLSEADRVVLSVRPGITGPATLAFRMEEKLLSMVDDPVRFNDEVVFPMKTKINLEYINQWSFFRDLGFIVVTVIPAMDRWLNLIPDAISGIMTGEYELNEPFNEKGELPGSRCK